MVLARRANGGVGPDVRHSRFRRAGRGFLHRIQVLIRGGRGEGTVGRAEEDRASDLKGGSSGSGIGCVSHCCRD